MSLPIYRVQMERRREMAVRFITLFLTPAGDM